MNHAHESLPPSIAAHLRADVEQLATEAGRMVGTPGHVEARAYLCERLAGLSLEPYGARFDLAYGGGELANVVARVPGRDRSLAPILIAAHYDTCGRQPGADDNAAAIAIALELATRLRSTPAERDLIVALFDGEEPPHFLSEAMGSIHWYHHQRREPVHCAIVLDLVGHDLELPGKEDLLFVTGMESDPELVFEDLDRPGLRVMPVLNRYVGDLSDHHVFRTHHRPYLFLSCGRWTHYHQRTDTPDRLNYVKMEAIAGLVEALVRELGTRGLDGPFGGGETLALEAAGIRRNFGVPVRRRWQIDAFVKAAMLSFGV